MVEHYSTNVTAVIYIVYTSPGQCAHILTHDGGRWACGSAEIMIVSRWHQHLQSGYSCVHPRLYGSNSAGMSQYRGTWGCLTGLFPCRAQRKLLPEPPWLCRSPPDDTPPGRQGGPRRHRTPCPIQSSSTFPLDPHTGAAHWPVLAYLQKTKSCTLRALIQRTVTWLCTHWKCTWPTVRWLCGGHGNWYLFCYSEITCARKVEKHGVKSWGETEKTEAEPWHHVTKTKSGLPPSSLPVRKYNRDALCKGNFNKCS